MRVHHRRRRVPRLYPLAIAVPMAVVGVVDLATSDVPPTNAGVTQVPVSVPTTLAAAVATTTADATSGYDVVMSATLSGQGLPVVDQTIVFTTGGLTCSASTDALGTASCGVSNLAVAPSSYSASFTGTGPYDTSSATGSVDA